MLNEKLPVLKMAAIYGANGAGKSNLLKGINFLKAIALNKSFLDKDTFGKYIFALKENTGTEPMELTIEFETKTGIPYIYSVEIMNTGIVSEILQISGLGSEENHNVFTRKEGKIEYAVTPSEEVGNMVLGWIEKNPFSSLLTINNDMPVLTDENISIAQKWFEDELTIIGLHSFNPALIGIFKSNKEINQFASDIFKVLGLGINRVNVETENFEDGNTSVTIGISNTEPTVNIKFQQIINDLEEENAMLKRRLEKSLPVHAISYIALNSVLLTLSVTLLILRFAYGVYTVDPYYLICMLIISITLLGTAVVSLKDWKKFLNETKRTR